MAEIRRQVDGQAEHFDAVWREASARIPDWVRRDRRGELLGPVAGKRVLDVGSGAGEWALYLAECGARVVATDVSGESMRQVRAAAATLGFADRLETVVLDAHRMPFADASFDLIHGQFILHHLDLARAGPELVRVLRPGGVAVFCETSASNPLLMFARRHLVGRFGIPRWSVPGEHPLRPEDVTGLNALFGSGSAHYFEFHCFEMVDSKLFRGHRVFAGLDPLIYRFLPAARHYGYTEWLRFERWVGG